MSNLSSRWPLRFLSVLPLALLLSSLCSFSLYAQAMPSSQPITSDSSNQTNSLLPKLIQADNLLTALISKSKTQETQLADLNNSLDSVSKQLQSSQESLQTLKAQLTNSENTAATLRADNTALQTSLSKLKDLYDQQSQTLLEVRKNQAKVARDYQAQRFVWAAVGVALGAVGGGVAVHLLHL